MRYGMLLPTLAVAGLFAGGCKASLPAAALKAGDRKIGTEFNNDVTKEGEYGPKVVRK